MSTGIEWTDETWNPVTGCDQVSPGCDNCYALTMSARLKAMGQPKYQRDGDPRTSGPGFGVTLHEDVLTQPNRWRKPRRVFVNSMSDLFHPEVPTEFIGRVFNVMGSNPEHTFQVLTKRHARMRAVTSAYYDATRQEPFTNVWLGVSVEDQQRADQRIPHLTATPAAVRFLSCEPLLGPVTIERWIDGLHCDHEAGVNCCGECECTTNMHDPALHWVIVGGESGHGARQMYPGWALTLVRQCRAEGVPVFVKQLGSAWGSDHHDPDTWPEELRVREWPDTARGQQALDLAAG